MKYAKMQGARSIHKNQLYFYTLGMNNQKRNFLKKILFIIATKRIKYLGDVGFIH